MSDARIPVDLFNPGQVFACLGFLECAQGLLGSCEGGFDWTDETQTSFCLRASGDPNPFRVVLEYLSEADIMRVAPRGCAAETVGKHSGLEVGEAEQSGEGPVVSDDVQYSDQFPAREADRMTLPVVLKREGQPAIWLTHCADGSSRNEFKLYSGNRSAFGIACGMLLGTGNSRGLRDLFNSGSDELVSNPFGVLTPMGGSFNFDPRGAWTAIDAGYSPNRHPNHGVAASPVVEILAALGMENARPDEFKKRKVRYAAWSGLLPPMLARPALCGLIATVPLRRFRFVLEMSGKNKVVTFAQEEPNT